MKVRLTIRTEGIGAEDVFEAWGTYDVPNDVLRREGLRFLQRLAFLQEASATPEPAEGEVTPDA